MMNEIMTQDREIHEKVRAVFLATLMVVSVFGGSIAFAGGAAAATAQVENVDTGETFSTIQAGINAQNTTDGDTLLLHGTFDRTGGEGAIVVNKSLTIKAGDSGASINNTGQTANSGPAGIVEIASQNVTISGVTFNTNASNLGGTPPVEMAIQANHTTITEVTVNREGQHSAPGIGSPGSPNLVGINITGNDFNGAAIGINGAGDGTIEITDNEVSQVADEGIFLSSGDLTNSTLVISGNSISNYDLSGSDKKAIKVATVPESINGQTSLGGQFDALFNSNSIDSAKIGDQEPADQDGTPNVTDATVLDRDGDGDVDAIDVTLSEPVNDGTLEASDFALGNIGADAQTPDNVSTGVSPYDAQFTLTFDDDNEIDGTDDRLSASVTGNVEDLAGNALDSFNESNFSDGASPIVEDVSFDPSVVNASNTINGEIPVTVTATFSEDIDTQPTTFTLNGVTIGTDVTVENSSITGTTDSSFGASGTDEFVNTTIKGAQDAATNTQVAFDQQNYEIDVVAPRLSTNTVTTLDSNDDGTVDQLEVEFADDLADSSVAVSDFEVTDPAATIDGWNTGTTENDNIVVLNVSGLPQGDTGVTPKVTLFESQIKDTAGNPGPYGGDQTQTAEDGASPVVTSLSVNETILNASDVPADVEVNATFSENVTGNPSVELLDLSQSPVMTTIAASGSNNLTATSDTEIVDNDEDVNVRVKVSGGNDGANNAVETFNSTTFDGETLLTVDTNEPTVSVNTSELPSEPVAGEIDLSSYFDVSGAESDGGETTYLINTTGATGGEFTEVSATFDTTTIDDTDSLLVRAVSTDDVGNEDQDTFTAAQSINVDNTAPTVTIDSPSETTAAPSNGTLPLEWTVDEQNIDGNATIVLEGGNNTIQYNASVSDGSGNTVDLRLNTSENATAGDGRLPNLNATNGSFDTQTLYDLSVTVDDTTGKSTTATLENALFLDDTKPANFSLLSPTTPDEYETDDKLVVSYGYTEDNTDEVTVSLTNESGAVANMTVDESQYENDGVIKSFEADLFDSFDTDSLADGKYNVSVTVTDLAGNKLVDTTDEASVYINNNDEGGDVELSEVDATADLNSTTEQVTVNVTYNVSVTDFDDPGALNSDAEEMLEDVNVTAADGLVTVSGEYYDVGTDSYVPIDKEVAVENFSNVEVVDNETITATKTVDVNKSSAWTDSEDYILDYTVDVSETADITVEADSTSASDLVDVNVNADSAQLIQNDPVEPSIEGIEVASVDVGDGFEDDDTLVVTFDRPVTGINGINADDFAYQDVSGDGSNYVTGVSDFGDEDTKIELTLAEDVNASDVGSDVISVQSDTPVLKNAKKPVDYTGGSAVIQESDAPALIDAMIGDNASTITVTFDQKVVADDGGALTAANFTFTGAANVTSVTHDAETDTATLVLTGDVTSEEVDSATVMVDGVSDRFGNEADDEIPVADETAPDGLEIQQPSERLVKQSGDTLTVAYEYTENVEGGVDSVTVELVGDEETYSYSIDDSQYANDGVLKTVTLDLNGSEVDTDELLDDQYAVKVTAEDDAGNTYNDSTSELVVINDDAPVVGFTSLNETDNVAPGDDVNVTFDLADSANITNVDVNLVNNGTVVDTTSFSGFAPTEDGEEYTRTITVPESIADNEAYNVSIEATDESGFTADGVSDYGLLDVNAEAPSIETIEGGAGSDTIEVTFNEDVETADGDISATDFAYQDVSGSGASAIEEVLAHDGDTVTLRLNTDVTASDLESDLVSVREGAIHDTAERDSFNHYVYAKSEFVRLDSNQPRFNLAATGNQPEIHDADTVVGEVWVDVEFDAPVVSPDGDITADDFTWKDGNDAGATTIVEVERQSETDILVKVDRAITPSDMTHDQVKVDEHALINPVASEEIDQPEYAGPRYASSGEAYELTDNTAPSVEIVSAGAINADNVENYEITLDTTSEPTDVSMTLTGPNGTEVSASETGVTGEVTLTFNASTLADGTVDHEVTVTDMGGNNASTSGTLTKDTDRPDITSVETDPESSIVTVTFNEPMADASADDFSMVGTDLAVEEVDQYDDDSVDLLLNGTVPVEAINNSEVMVNTTAEDLAGSAADDSAKLMDTSGPYIQSVDAEEGSSTVNVTVNEPVSDSENVTADAFDYLDANGDGDEIVNVTTLSPTKFQLEFNDSVTTADLVNDEIALTENATDLLGNEATGDWYVSLDYSDYPALSASADGSTVTLTLETAANLSAETTSLTIDLEERDSLRSTTGEFDEPFSTELNASDFTETSDGVYEATVEVPDDGIYMATGGLATQGASDGLSATAEVDTAAPGVADAVLSGIATTDFENDGEPDSTLTVTFSEPVNATEITPDDVSIEGHDGDVLAVSSAGAFGYIEITVEGTVQTGTSPEVSIDSSSYTELAGDGSTGVEDSATVLHTAKLDLSEGTNFVSVPAAAGELDLDEMDLSNVDVIYSYDAADDSWDAFDPDAKENDFDELHGGQGYIFEMDDEDTLDVNVYNEPLVTGDVAVPSEQQLTEGWNLVGHYQEFDQNASTAFSSVSDSVYAVYGQNEASAVQSYEVVAMGDDLEPGEAYWVFVTDDEVYAEASAHQTPH